MLIDELWRVASWLISSNSHCDVLEERSSALLDKMYSLQAQQQQDIVVHRDEMRSVQMTHANLDRLAEVARVIEAESAKVLPQIVAEEQELRQNAKRMQNEVVVALMPEVVMNAEQALLAALKQIKGE